jgi:hypothetical protein
MRSHVPAILTALSSLGGLGACRPESDPLPIAPADGPIPLAPSFAITPSAAGGALILRFSTFSFILVFDAEHQLLSAHMPSDICGAGELNRVEVQRVITPSAIGQVVAQVSGDERVAVYHAASPADAGLSASIDFFGFPNVVNFPVFCSFLAGPNLIAEGTVQRLSTFSAASFHARWTGSITGVDGTLYRLTEIYQLNADAHDPTNPATFAQQVASIRLTPLP